MALYGLREPDERDGEVVGTGELARRLGVSRTWVLNHADQLGGWRKGTGYWQFSYERAVVAFRRYLIGSGHRQTIVLHCWKCGADTVAEKGGLGVKVLAAPHLPGMCVKNMKEVAG
jgi:hypothetical protein